MILLSTFNELTNFTAVYTVHMRVLRSWCVLLHGPDDGLLSMALIALDGKSIASPLIVWDKLIHMNQLLRTLERYKQAHSHIRYVVSSVIRIQMAKKKNHFLVGFVDVNLPVCDLHEGIF